MNILRNQITSFFLPTAFWSPGKASNKAQRGIFASDVHGESVLCDWWALGLPLACLRMRRWQGWQRLFLTSGFASHSQDPFSSLWLCFSFLRITTVPFPSWLELLQIFFINTLSYIYVWSWGLPSSGSAVNCNYLKFDIFIPHPPLNVKCQWKASVSLLAAKNIGRSTLKYPTPVKNTSEPACHRNHWKYIQDWSFVEIL